MLTCKHSKIASGFAAILDQQKGAGGLVPPRAARPAPGLAR